MLSWSKVCHSMLGAVTTVPSMTRANSPVTQGGLSLEADGSGPVEGSEAVVGQHERDQPRPVPRSRRLGGGDAIEPERRLVRQGVAGLVRSVWPLRWVARRGVHCAHDVEAIGGRAVAGVRWRFGAGRVALSIGDQAVAIVCLFRTGRDGEDHGASDRDQAQPDRDRLTSGRVSHRAGRRHAGPGPRPDPGTRRRGPTPARTLPAPRRRP